MPSDKKQKYIEDRHAFWFITHHKAAMVGLICAYAATGIKAKLEEARYFQTYLLKKFHLPRMHKAELLLPYINLKDTKGRTPLFVAADYEKYHLILDLIKRGCDWRSEYQGLNIFEYLFVTGRLVDCDINTVNQALKALHGSTLTSEGRTLPQLFIETCSLDRVPTAYRREWISQTDKYGRPPLVAALHLGDSENFVWLLSRDADIHQKYESKDLSAYIITAGYHDYFAYLMPYISLEKSTAMKKLCIPKSHPLALVLKCDELKLFKMFNHIRGVSNFNAAYYDSAVKIAIHYKSKKILKHMQSIWPQYFMQIAQVLNPPKPPPALRRAKSDGCRPTGMSRIVKPAIAWGDFDTSSPPGGDASPVSPMHGA